MPPMEEMGKSAGELEVELEMESDRRPEGGGETQEVDVEIHQDGKAGDVEGGGQEQTTEVEIEQIEVEGAAASDWSRGGPGGGQEGVTAVDGVTADGKKKEMDKEMTRFQKMDRGMTAGFGWRRKAKIQWVTAKEEEEEVGPLLKNMKVWEKERQKKQDDKRIRAAEKLEEKEKERMEGETSFTTTTQSTS